MSKAAGPDGVRAESITHAPDFSWAMRPGAEQRGLAPLQRVAGSGPVSSLLDESPPSQDGLEPEAQQVSRGAGGSPKLVAPAHSRNGAHRQNGGTPLAGAGTRINPYAHKKRREDSAEAFAIHTTDPATLQRLRPKLFDYFTQSYPRGTP